MNRRQQTIWKLSAMVLALLLLTLASGCKKKTPPPPPPPPPPVQQKAPPAAKPSITDFSAEPSTIEKGQAATLRWAVSNATDMSIDNGIGAVQSSGSRQVYPSNTTTYTLNVSGPGGSDSRTVTVTVSAPPPPPPPAAPQPSMSAADMLSREGQDAFFDYDKYDIRSDARDALTHDADLLKRILGQNSGVIFQLQGSADERGSAEYNLALGDRRAVSAKDFLVSLGVPADRLTTVSFGNQRPVCTEASEECYQRNRRVHIAVGQ